ncbi:hypothetical protein ABD80_20240 [Bacillus atrophaeus]|uniref:Uncharacterized protein n=1 Tax=Bacillus atrophaeus (strain 1942) TaxID=720555 RepID=A0ABM5LX84_BACA1|nr:hypothetical protein BATR1942_07650 [Bacillus atrophaeus 1942]AMR62671.1 hypothetical protein A1D11_09755 [Bacillus subtilis subsp. globigii]EIM11731.1 hypothetical protein UY9_05712 [Bacillus atrophaeus C89]KFK83893.1 hypothetical protein DK44_2206 [Bacillus atrophaeus]MBG9762118.1 hypothetical protein [Bacillus atrophaeus]
MKSLCCETCGLDTHKNTAPIFEKPLRFAFRSDVNQLKQNTGDHRKQENICLDCFAAELKQVSKDCKTRYKIRAKESKQ